MSGPLMNGGHEDVRDFSRVRVVCADSASVQQDIQEALDQGKDVVLAPGIYNLNQTVQLRQPKQVLLGLGLPTLVAPLDGSPCLQVAPGVSGARIAGIMLEASERQLDDEQQQSDTCKSSSLLEWGYEGQEDLGMADNPGGLFDVFCRVGGATAGDRTRISVDYMMRIHSGNIVADHLWLWRADHGILGSGEAANYPHITATFWQSEKSEFPVKTGAVFNGHDISVFGLAVEHTDEHQTIWNGERGSVHFYQCELPYGAGHEFADGQFRGYKVGSHVKVHEVFAPGVYSNFRNEDVVVSTSIEHPETESVVCHNPFTVKLDNNGGINSIANGKGGMAFQQGQAIRMN
jgi:hypothetical protein